MIIVIADDITGAAEIAGIASRHGLVTRLMTRLSTPLPPADVLVLATDMRSGSEEEAVMTTKEIAALICSARNPHAGKGTCTCRPDDVVLFKKTDSALRGHIIAETRAMTDAFGFDSALLIPQNPSKDRIIYKGTYYIKGVELAGTAFRYDPEFPALTSDVCRRLAGARLLTVDGDMDKGIYIADAMNAGEMTRQISKADAGTLMAGAADCFEAMLQNKGWGTATSAGRQSRDCDAMPRHAHVSSLLVVCGSTQSRSLKDEPYIKKMGAEEMGMPKDVFHGGDPERWLTLLERSYRQNGSLVMTIGQPSTGGKAYAVRLRNLMSLAASRLVRCRRPDSIIIEGGATAYTLLNRLGWHSFTIREEIAPGVVCMHHDGTDIILKPGSYPWGNLFSTHQHR